MKMSETSQASSENEKSLRPQGSRKRQVHNETERRRKDRINGWITKIGELLPSKELHKQSKISILEQTVDYIKLLVAEREKLLSENRSEVQADEVNQLKKELKLVQEQNAVYEKLLQQANISLNSLPKKSFKYSDRFERRNGVLTVKNSDSNISCRVDSTIPINSDNGNAHSGNGNSLSSNASRKEKSSVSKNSKPSTKNSHKVKNVVSICSTTTVSNVPVVETRNQTTSCAIITSTTSIATINVIPQSCQISQGSIPNVVCNDVAKDSTFHTGGVTTVLSQFPLMSTTHGSSLVNMCNKNMSTIIIPSGGGILQHFPAAEKPSNTISIICPSTLPIIVPQQVFNVSSVARSVNLPSALICPAQASEPCSQTEKSTLGNAVLTINSSSVVPISSNISANAQIILPSQATVLGNACGGSDLTHNVISSLVNPLPQVSNDQIIVPLLQKALDTTAVVPVEKCVQSSNSASSFTGNQNMQNKNREDSSSKETRKGNVSSESIISEQCKVINVGNVPASVAKSKNVVTTSDACTKNKISSPSKKIRNFSSNSLPSLQVLSANKIISLANQSQKVRSNLSLPLYQKEATQTPSVSLLSSGSKSTQCSNDFCLQIDAPGVSSNLNENQANSSSNPQVSNIPAVISPQVSIKHHELTSKSNFSLTVLMGDSIDNKSENSSKVTKDLGSSELRNSSIQTPTTQKTNIFQEKLSTFSDTSSVTTVTYSSIPIPSTASNSSKDNSTLVNSHISTSMLVNRGINPELHESIKHTSQKSVDNEKSSPLNVNSTHSLSIAQHISNTKNVPCANSNLATITSSSISNTSIHDSFAKSNYMNMFSKSNSSPIKDMNILQNHAELKQSSESINPMVSVSSANAFSENVPFVVNDSGMSQNILPSLFSTAQIVTLNSSVFVCPVQEIAPTSGHLNQGGRSSSTVPTATINSCMIPNVCVDSPSFTTLNKENLSATFSSLVSNENSKVSSESVANILPNSGMHDATDHFIGKNASHNSQKNDKTISSSNCPKQMPSAKKKKTSPKGKSISTDVQHICNSNNVSVNSDFELSKLQSTENSNSFPKSDEAACMRQESSNNFLFTSDILARATESIFGNDMLESPHMSKRTLIYYTEDASHMNVPVSLPEKQNDSNYKLLCLPTQEDRTTESSSNIISENNKKNSATSNVYSTNVSGNQEANDLNAHEMNQKQNKACKIRKTKSVLELEPPMKRIKDNSELPDKSSNPHPFTTLNQTGEIEKGHVSSGLSNIPFTEKHVSVESHISEGDHPVIDSVGHFGNQIHIPENSCKTPTSVDAIFSITPSLGDILKDVSHGIGMENRNNNYLVCNENHAIFPGEKNFLSLNFTNNSNEEYLNLPRMHFPVSSEISSTPVLQTTNVSYAHTVSLCSTQSETSKTTETLSSTDPQSKPDAKKKPALCNAQDNSSITHNLVTNNSITKSTDCVPKLSSSEPAFSIPSKVQNSSSSMLFDSQPEVHGQSINVSHSANSIISQADSHFSSRDNFTSVSHTVPFYPTLSNSTNLQNFVSSSSSMLPHTNFHSSSSSNLTNLSFPIQAVNTSTNTTFNPQSTLPFSHSLCSLLKENVLGENRTGSNGPSSQSISSSSASNISQSKYSALSLISDHTSYSEPPTSSTCHSEYVHNSVVCTPTVSDGQFTSTNSSCSRNQRSSLSYSAESLLQTSCVSSDKNKSKNAVANRYPQRLSEKKSERNNITSMHNINDTNIFMPVSSCDISIQNAPLVPLPPVTSFHNFPSTYTLCETVPSTTIFNTVTRTHDVPLSLSNENFLNHMSLTVESQMLGNRHDVSSTVPKPHTNITIPFENHGSIYNNCNFLPHVKPTLESSRASEAGSCFPPASFSNSYSQSTQKTNCCHFSHRTHPEHPTDISLSVGPPVPSFHPDKSNFQSNRSTLQPTFTQSNTNYVGNLFYNATASGRDVNDMTAKPSNIRPTQESYVPEAPRQNLHDHNPTIIFPNRKATSNRSKSKKLKNISMNEGNINLIPNSMASFTTPQDSPCSKANISCVPNGYYKNNTHSVIPSPSQLPCSQHKIVENTSNSVIPTNPPFNSVLHQQGDNFFNLNFQPSNFTMSPLPRPPTQPLSCSCLTTPIISHTFSSTNHPVPNFNLSNILPDMGCSGNQVPLPSVKFPPVNHSLQSSSAQCQTNSTISNSAHIISHQSCAPSLYPPHPPIVRGPLNPILSHNPQSYGDSQVPLVGTGATPVMPQNTTFSATQNPTFRNVIHSLSFSRGDR